MATNKKTKSETAKMKKAPTAGSQRRKSPSPKPRVPIPPERMPQRVKRY